MESKSWKTSDSRAIKINFVYRVVLVPVRVFTVRSWYLSGCLPGGLGTCQGVYRAVLVPFRVFTFKRSAAGAFAVSFRVLSRKKNMTGDNVLVPLRGEKKSRPRPQKMILVPLRNFMENFRRAPLSFFYGSSPPPWVEKGFSPVKYFNSTDPFKWY